MAVFDTVWYCNAGDQSTTGHYAVAKRPQNAAVTVGQIVRQFTAPAVGSERCFICIVAGTTANVTDATWVLTRGGKTTDGTATWQECTGISAVNGDNTNTMTWAQIKAIANPSLGVIIKRNNGASYQICSISGTLGASEPAFSNTPGTTTVDNTATWTCIGLVGSFTTGGAAPHARLANVFGALWFAAGNTCYVGANHAESQATAITITVQGSVASGTVGKVVCHNQAGSYPPATGDVTTGATITTTAAVSLTFTSQGSVYAYGLIFQAGSGASAACSVILGPDNGGIFLDNCSLQLLTTNNTTSSTINFGGAGAFTFILLNNTTVKFAQVAQNINLLAGSYIWQNTPSALAAGSSVPTNLFFLNTAAAAVTLVVEAVDLSAITGVVNYNAAMSGPLLFKDCKINAAATFANPPTTGVPVQLVRCDSGATGYKSARYLYEGTETTETAITRVGGAVDPTGQAQSRKIATTANAQWLRPFRAEPYAIWNDRIAANVTVTVYGTINAGALPRNDDIWMDVEYLGSSASPQGTIKSTTVANLLTADAAVASDGSSWNGGGSGAGWSPFKLTTTLSSPQPGLAGYIHARVRAGAASTTFYIDPTVVLS